jgi:hypothetical protein
VEVSEGIFDGIKNANQFNGMKTLFPASADLPSVQTIHTECIAAYDAPSGVSGGKNVQFFLPGLPGTEETRDSFYSDCQEQKKRAILFTQTTENERNARFFLPRLPRRKETCDSFYSDCRERKNRAILFIQVVRNERNVRFFLHRLPSREESCDSFHPDCRGKINGSAGISNSNRVQNPVRIGFCRTIGKKRIVRFVSAGLFGRKEQYETKMTDFYFTNF